MQRTVALMLGVLMAVLGVSGVGQAQSTSGVQVQGVIEAVDCQSGTVQLSSPSGTNTIYAAQDTVALVGATSVPFCGLQDYVGAPATAWLVPNGDQFSATQVAVTGPAPMPAPPSAAISPLPLVGVVLGTVVDAGLVYLLVHGPDGGYYRYPYYGDYYRYYYRAGYRPFTGAYPATAPIITVAPAITGVVLGIVLVNNYQYLLTRDGGGHYYRYPYYGPYRQHYYRATYRPYSGTFRAYQSAPVRQGDPRWDMAAHAVHVPAPTVRPSVPQRGNRVLPTARPLRPINGVTQRPQGTPQPVRQVQQVRLNVPGTPQPRGNQGPSTVQQRRPVPTQVTQRSQGTPQPVQQVQQRRLNVPGTPQPRGNQGPSTVQQRRSIPTQVTPRPQSRPVSPAPQMRPQGNRDLVQQVQQRQPSVQTATQSRGNQGPSTVQQNRSVPTPQGNGRGGARGGSSVQQCGARTPGQSCNGSTGRR